MSAADAEPHSETSETVTDPSNPAVLDKYKLAASIAQSALATVIADVKPGAKALELAAKGDAAARDQCSKVLTKDKKLEKGVAFPTCVSINGAVGHVSPVAANDAHTVSAGDVVKVDLAVHIDGFIASVAQTVYVPHTETDAATSSKAADLMHALNTASEASLRLLRPGTKNTAITDMIAKASAAYGVSPVQGVLSHAIDRYVIDGPKVILNRGGDYDRETKVEEWELTSNTVLVLDLVLSTGEGKPKQSDEFTTIYKRIPDSKYALKLNASREVFGEICKTSPVFPFTLRNYDSAKAKIAIKECLQHGLFHSYPVLTERNELVAQYKVTVLITEQGPVKLTNSTIELKGLTTDKKVSDEEVKKLLSQPILVRSDADAAAKAKKNAKKKAAKAKKAAAGVDANDDEDEAKD